ncbi:MAG: IS3 family transposase [Candidatus Pacebacteria bacterium]|nr:IS3 family transposase [Candidatus Paceibacterota bacterium]
MITHLKTHYSTTAICGVLGANHSNYQHYLNHTRDLDKQKDLEDTLIRDEIEKLINKPASSRYGYKPMTKQLRRDSFKINDQFVNHKRVLRIMRENNLLCEIKKSFINTTNSDHTLKTYSNILKKERSEVTRPDQVWASDITYIRLPEGFVYLSAIIDLFSRKIIGYCLSKHIDSDLVISALKMAIKERKINNAHQALIHHSDQGVQYCSHDYTNLLDFHDIRISMSNPGSPWQNGFAESFFKTLKTNEVYLNDYQNIWEAKQNLFKFIDQIYNQERLHSSLGYLPPSEFERKYWQEKNIKNYDQAARIR